MYYLSGTITEQLHEGPRTVQFTNRLKSWNGLNDKPLPQTILLMCHISWGRTAITLACILQFSPAQNSKFAAEAVHNIWDCVMKDIILLHTEAGTTSVRKWTRLSGMVVRPLAGLYWQVQTCLILIRTVLCLRLLLLWRLGEVFIHNIHIFWSIGHARIGPLFTVPSGPLHIHMCSCTLLLEDWHFSFYVRVCVQ